MAGGLALGIASFTIGFAFVLDIYSWGTRFIRYAARTRPTERQRKWYTENERAYRPSFGIAFLIIGAVAIAISARP